MGKVIVLGNQKGGAGKTTLALTLACGLKAEGLSVCLIDADPQGSLVSWAARAEGQPHEAQLPDLEPNASVLIGQSVARARGRYDVVIVDTASNMGLKGDGTQKLILGALREADYVIIPVGPSPLDIDASGEYVDLLRDLWERREMVKPEAHFVVNNVKKGTFLSKEIKGALTETFGLPVLESEIFSREPYKKSLLTGGSVFNTKDKDVIENAKCFVDEVRGVIKL